MRGVILVLVLLLAIVGASASLTGCGPDRTLETNLNQTWSEPYAAMAADGHKIGVVLEVKALSGDGLVFINYVVFRDNPHREFAGFHYADSSKNITYSRLIGGSVDTRIVGDVGSAVETGISDPAADRIFDKVKNLLNAEMLIGEYLKARQPPGWPASWPSTS